MDALSYPFRIEATGQPAKVSHGSDEWGAQQIYAFFMTEQGTRSLAPNFGSRDLLFLPEIHAGGLLVSFAEFYPEISVDNIDIVSGSDGKRAVSVEFSIVESEDTDV